MMCVYRTRHVRDLTDRTDVADRLCLSGLVARSQEYGKTRLAETSPGVLHQVGFYQHANSILQFEVVLDNERIARVSTLERRFPGIHCHGLKK